MAVTPTGDVWSRWRAAQESRSTSRGPGCASGPAVLYENDTAYADREQLAADHLRGQEVEVEVNLGTSGVSEATVWTCDLSAEYVRINADYRT